MLDPFDSVDSVSCPARDQNKQHYRLQFRSAYYWRRFLSYKRRYYLEKYIYGDTFFTKRSEVVNALSSIFLVWLKHELSRKFESKTAKSRICSLIHMVGNPHFNCSATLRCCDDTNMTT